MITVIFLDNKGRFLARISGINPIVPLVGDRIELTDKVGNGVTGIIAARYIVLSAAEQDGIIVKVEVSNLSLV